MLRMLGAVCLAGGCAWMGFRASAVLRGRVRALESMEYGLVILEQELELDAWPLPDLMKQLEQRSRGTAQTIFSGCRTGLERLEEEDFSTLWRRLVAERSELGVEGQTCLYPLGDILGRCDSQSQCQQIRTVRSHLEMLKGRMEESCCREGKVCRVLGLSGGAFLVILLL